MPEVASLEQAFLIACRRGSLDVLLRSSNFVMDRGGVFVWHVIRIWTCIMDYDEPKTPSKKRKRMTSTKGTPRKRAHPTPNSRARLHRSSNPHKSPSTKSPSKKSPLKVRPPPPVPFPLKRLALEALPKDPWLRAMHALHVGSRPDELPCREEEYAKCLRSVEELVGEGEGGCVCRFPFSIISLGEY
jgi:hypothetical protein